MVKTRDVFQTPPQGAREMGTGTLFMRIYIPTHKFDNKAKQGLAGEKGSHLVASIATNPDSTIPTRKFSIVGFKRFHIKRFLNMIIILIGPLSQAFEIVLPGSCGKILYVPCGTR